MRYYIICLLDNDDPAIRRFLDVVIAVFVYFDFSRRIHSNCLLRLLHLLRSVGVAAGFVTLRWWVLGEFAVGLVLSHVVGGGLLFTLFRFRFFLFVHVVVAVELAVKRYSFRWLHYNLHLRQLPDFFFFTFTFLNELSGSHIWSLFLLRLVVITSHTAQTMVLTICLINLLVLWPSQIKILLW